MSFRRGRTEDADPERRPLLADVRLSSPQPRYPQGRVFSRYVSYALAGTLFYLLLNFFFPEWPPSTNPRIIGALYSLTDEGRIPYERLEKIMLKTPSEDKVREYSEYYTSGPHLGGQNYSQAVWTKEKFESFGISSTIATYDIYVNYPRSHYMALSNATGTENNGLLFEASLEEEVLEADPSTGLKDRIPTFNGYSANGNVTAEYVWVNYGTFRDFEDLLSHGVNITGKIVICRYGKIFRGLKVKRAQELGSIGVLLYSDPGDDGEITELNGYKAYPDGPARNKHSVQRGSVQFISIAPGDPTTPGYPSLPGAPRQDPHHSIPSIPSLPISYVDALPLLVALNGYGLNSSDLGGDWGTGGLWHEGVKYNIGPAPELVVNLVNDVEYKIAPQWDVIGTIEGIIKDEVVILGNHRDAWVAGGAGDPNSGSAALLELARAFGHMMEEGWKPARTIVLASWDGEEYGLLGSTEWVEEHTPWLRGTAVAYINVDVGARSPIFAVAANPLLQDVLHMALQKVVDPRAKEKGHEGASVFEMWNKKIRTLGSGSDYTAFQDFIGIPSIDMGFSGLDKTGPVYHYHSNYDSFHWMEKFGDPSFEYHTAISKIWGLIALQLSENPIISLNATAYATGLASYLERITKDLSNPPSTNNDSEDDDDDDNDDDTDKSEGNFHHHLRRLHDAVSRFAHTASHFDARAAHLAKELARDDLNRWRRLVLWIKARRVNTQYKLLDRAFVYPKGLDGRPLFKHVIYAPGKWTGYAGYTFPGLVESIEDKDWENAIRWSHIIERSVNAAKRGLH